MLYSERTAHCVRNVWSTTRNELPQKGNGSFTTAKNIVYKNLDKELHYYRDIIILNTTGIS